MVIVADAGNRVGSKVEGPELVIVGVEESVIVGVEERVIVAAEDDVISSVCVEFELSIGIICGDASVVDVEVVILGVCGEVEEVEEADFGVVDVVCGDVDVVDVVIVGISVDVVDVDVVVYVGVYDSVP